jgi:hypothetical protein
MGVPLTAMDEYFVHQIPEPLPNVQTHHDFWRESLFFIAHPRDGLGDVLILTMAHFPKAQEMDVLQLGRVGGKMTAAKHVRAYDGDPHTLVVPPASIEIIEPYKELRLLVEDHPDAPVTLDLTFTARTRENGYRRGTMKAGHEIIWDQSHMIQSGTYNGTYTHKSVTYEVSDWWGQRDHSWGIRDHARCPLWMWFAIQFDEGMLGIWNWEYSNGARVYTDGCFAPSDMSDPIPVIDFRYDLHWTDEAGAEVSYERDGDDVHGIAGTSWFTLEGGRVIEVETEGRWAQRYGPPGGGLMETKVRTTDGWTGTAIYEVTGAHHHHWFPIARGVNLPPGGGT